MPTQYPYQKTIYHQGLNKSKRIKATSAWDLQNKITMQYNIWEEQWNKKIDAEKRQREKELRAHNIELSLEIAEEKTIEAERYQDSINNLLVNSLVVQLYDFEAHKDYSPFSEKKPKEPQYPGASREPLRADVEFNPKPGFFTKIISSKLETFNKNNDAQYESAHKAWEEAEIERKAKINRMCNAYAENVKAWEERKNVFETEQAKTNQLMDDFENSVIECDPEAVAEYVVMSLEEIEMPLDYSTSYDAELNGESRMLIVDVELPVIEDISNLKSVSFVKSKNEFKETYFPESYMKKTYDNVVYQIVLQTINYAVTIGEKYNAFDSVVLNGYISTVDKATGKDIHPCILSVNVKCEDFKSINLTAVDPKAWFKSTRGISAATFATVTPVAPIVAMEREDSRFVEGYEVVNTIDEGSNLAAMDWQDFENLIREVFEQEFNSTGGEVKVTQASRDGGVDAVVFDPDPIRGGKIVIQAKRYTNVVGVSAVRDLYGTVMNEGAMKGILVTTSYFGNDAYEFANGKPLQLMTGANLLSLLEKHGHKATIDLNEAKKILNSNN